MNMTAAEAKPLTPVTMVLVTDQFRCERLITAGRALADRSGTSLSVINVAGDAAERNPQAIEYLYQVSKDNNATMMIHYSDDQTKYLIQLIREEMPSNVVTGMPQGKSSLLHRIWMRFEQISFFVVDEKGKLSPVTLKDRVTA